MFFCPCSNCSHLLIDQITLFTAYPHGHPGSTLSDISPPQPSLQIYMHLSPLQFWQTETLTLCIFPRMRPDLLNISSVFYFLNSICSFWFFTWVGHWCLKRASQCTCPFLYVYGKGRDGLYMGSLGELALTHKQLVLGICSKNGKTKYSGRKASMERHKQRFWIRTFYQSRG